MQIKFSQPILDLRGKHVFKEDKTHHTLADLAIDALMGPPREMISSIPAREKLAMHALSAKIVKHEGHACHITTEEAALIKKYVGFVGFPIAVARMEEALDDRPKVVEEARAEADPR